MAAAEFEIVQVLEEVIYIADLDRGGRSVTNDAEAVVEELAAAHLARRIVYRDTAGRWDELRHEDGRFVGFAPWAGPVPQMAADPADGR